MRLADFDALTFDCYGTLIDWESGIVTALQSLLARVTQPPTRDAVLELFARHETRLEKANPQMLYRELLTQVHDALADDWGVATNAAESRRFGGSVGDWPAFDDTQAALRYLQLHYRLIILSNVDRESFRASNNRLGVTFDAICTAEDVGSYKPDPRNFAFMIEQLATMGIADLASCTPHRACSTTTRRRTMRGSRRRGSIVGTMRRAGVPPRHRPWACTTTSVSPASPRWCRRTSRRNERSASPAKRKRRSVVF